jgi:hypothetical protein
MIRRVLCENSRNIYPDLFQYSDQGSPPSDFGSLQPPSGGDVYINETSLEVWYYSGSAWVPWQGVSEGASHPTVANCFLVPGKKHFAWKESDCFPSYLGTSVSAWVQEMLKYQDENPELYQECVTQRQNYFVS